MTRLLAAAVLLALVTCLVGGCSMGCVLPGCTVTTTDGLTLTGDVIVRETTIDVYGPQGHLSVAHKQVATIVRKPTSEANTRRTP